MLPPLVLRFLALSAYAAIAAASLVPRDYRPVSGLMSGAMEHAAAYFVLGLLAAIAFLPRQPALGAPAARLMAFNTGYAGLLECLQFIVPGRVPALRDFVAGAFGAAIGTALAPRARNLRLP